MSSANVCACVQYKELWEYDRKSDTKEVLVEADGWIKKIEDYNRTHK